MYIRVYSSSYPEVLNRTKCCMSWYFLTIAMTSTTRFTWTVIGDSETKWFVFHSFHHRKMIVWEITGTQDCHDIQYIFLTCACKLLTTAALIFVPIIWMWNNIFSKWMRYHTVLWRNAVAAGEALLPLVEKIMEENLLSQSLFAFHGKKAYFAKSVL